MPQMRLQGGAEVRQEAAQGQVRQLRGTGCPDHAGRKGHEVDAIARTFVQDHGYEEYQHALGHQVGQEAHDGGTLLGPLWDRYGTSPEGIIEAGNVFTLELYVTTENYGQVSLEEDIVVTTKGCSFLSRPQTELICLPTKSK